MDTTVLLDETKDNLQRLTQFGPMLPTDQARRGALRIFMSIAQGMKCHYCEKRLNLAPGPKTGKHPHDLATFEHVVDEWSSPTGKDNRLEHIVIACYACNSARNKHRSKEVNEFYRSKFPTKELYNHFATKAKPSDFIAMFGICPDTWQPKRFNLCS